LSLSLALAPAICLQLPIEHWNIRAKPAIPSTRIQAEDGPMQSGALLKQPQRNTEQMKPNSWQFLGDSPHDRPVLRDGNLVDSLDLYFHPSVNTRKTPAGTFHM
jgi:hypothetical protein